MSKNGFIEKTWGYEIAWVNNDQYCGKILCFRDAGSKTATYFNQTRRKSWFVNSGRFLVRWIDTKTAVLSEKILIEGEVWHTAPMVPHQLEALVPDSMIFEVSSTDIAEDYFKLSDGDV